MKKNLVTRYNDNLSIPFNNKTLPVIIFWHCLYDRILFVNNQPDIRGVYHRVLTLAPHCLL